MSLELNYRNKLHEVVREVKNRLVRISVVCVVIIVFLLLCNIFLCFSISNAICFLFVFFDLSSTWPVMLCM